MKQLSSLLIPFLLIACGVQKPNQGPVRDSYHYEVNGESIGVEYESIPNQQDKSVDLKVKVGDKNFDISVSSETGLKTLDGHDKVLSPEERLALGQASLEFSRLNALTETSSFEQKALYLALDYLSQAPQNFVFKSSKNHSLNLKNEGVSCIKKGSTVKAEWNTKTLSYVSENIVVGANWPNNYGCMGRCGADCGWGAPSSWTKDCLDHDACSFRNSASGGASDPNCGDEYNESSDDWFWGVIVGCSGQ